MSLEENKAIIRSLFEAENKRDLAVLDNLLAPDFVDHCHQLRGLESYKQFLTMIFNVFPDYHTTIEDIIAEDDKVWVRTTYTGTHKGDYQGIAPTGKKLTFSAVDIWRIVDGKVVEGTSVCYFLGFLKQLGLIECELSFLLEKIKNIDYKGFPDEDVM